MAAHAGVQPSSTSTIIDLTNIHSNIKGMTHIIELFKLCETPHSNVPQNIMDEALPFAAHPPERTRWYKV